MLPFICLEIFVNFSIEWPMQVHEYISWNFIKAVESVDCVVAYVYAQSERETLVFLYTELADEGHLLCCRTVRDLPEPNYLSYPQKGPIICILTNAASYDQH